MEALKDETEMRPEHDVHSYVERGATVRAFLFQGPFPLEILGKYGRVFSAGDGSGECLIQYGPDPERKFRLRMGYWLVNHPDLGLFAVDDERFQREYMQMPVAVTS